jgi:hypothetical protein
MAVSVEFSSGLMPHMYAVFGDLQGPFFSPDYLFKRWILVLLRSTVV